MAQKSKQLRSSSRLLALEPRLLFDGAAMIAAQDATGTDDTQQTEAASHASEKTSEHGSEHQKQLDFDGSFASIDAVNVVVIDSRVPQLDELVADLKAGGAQVHVVQANESGLSAISNALAQAQNADSLHIISHGSSGSITLGTDIINNNTLQANGAQVQDWAYYLTQDADIMLYGCDVAAGEQGESFIKELAFLSGADIAASTNATGAAALSADWILEKQTGDIEAKLALSKAITDQYAEKLADATPTPPKPEVSIDQPQQTLPGSTTTVTVTFDNTGEATGYGPYVDLFVPRKGTDGSTTDLTKHDGASFDTASYAGSTVESKTYTLTTGSEGEGTIKITNDKITHPITKEVIDVPSGFGAGDQLVVLTLPFGSFTADQPKISLNVTLTISDKADPGTLQIAAISGFMFGKDALDNPVADAPIRGESSVKSITVDPYIISASITAPEGETATGSNFVHDVVISITAANGSTISDSAELSLQLPDGIVLTNVDALRTTLAAQGWEIKQLPQYDNNTGNDVLVLKRVEGKPITGTGQPVTFNVSFYVAETFQTGNAVLDAANGASRLISFAPGSLTLKDAQWQGIAGSNLSNSAKDEQAVSAAITAGSITAKSIAVIKGSNAPEAGIKPGESVDFSLKLDVSDYFRTGDIYLQDIIADGLTFDVNKRPSMKISWTDANGVTHTETITFDPEHVLVKQDDGNWAPWNGTDPLNTLGNGSTEIRFNVSQQLITQHGHAAAAQMVGGFVNTDGSGSTLTNGHGATTATVTYSTKVEENYRSADSVTNTSGNLNLKLRDELKGGATASADILKRTDGELSSADREDDSNASISVVGSEVKLEIDSYIRNGVRYEYTKDTILTAGDQVTYKLIYDLPIKDYENLILDAYLPMPVFDITNPDTKFEFAGDSTLDGTLSSTKGEGNHVRFELGSSKPVQSNGDGKVAILITVTVTDTPMADKLHLTTQGQSSDDSSTDTGTTTSSITQIVIGSPDVVIHKGYTNKSDTQTGVTDQTFTPGGALTSSNIAGIGTSNASKFDGGDKVTVTIAVENKGSSPKGAFDVGINDKIDTNLDPTKGSLKFYSGNNGTLITSVEIFKNGAWTSVTVAGNEAEVFDALQSANGIRFADSSASGALAQGQSINQATGEYVGNSTGGNIIYVTYEATVKSSNTPDTTSTSVATLSNFSNKEAGQNILASPLTDSASIGFNSNKIDLIITSTPDHSDTTVAIGGKTANAVVGEYVDYQLTINVSEATTKDAEVVVNLGSGLGLVNVGGMTIPGSGLDATTSGFGESGSTIKGTAITADGQVVNITLKSIGNGNFVVSLGDLVNAQNDSGKETITFNFRAVVLNTATNTSGAAGDPLKVTATLTGADSSAAERSATVTVQEPKLTATLTADKAIVTADNTVTYTLTVNNNSGYAAHDVQIRELLNKIAQDYLGDLTLITGSAITTGGGTISGAGITSNGIEYDITVLENGKSFTVEFTAKVAPTTPFGQVLTIDPTITWTSLSGDHADQGAIDSATADSERTGNGGFNNYTTTPEAKITFATPIPGISIDSTDNASTSGPSDPIANTDNDASAKVAIGETVRIRLEIELPESTSTDIRIKPNLPPGLTYLGNGKIGYLSDQGIGISDERLGGDLASANPTANITIDPVSGEFILGNLNNLDRDADGEYIILEFDVRVDDIQSNKKGDTLNLNYTLNSNGSPVTSGNVTLTVVEPTLTIDKSVSDVVYANKNPSSNNYAEVTYTVTITNKGDATAHDIWLTDILPDGEAIVGSPSITGGFSNSGTGSGLTYKIPSLAVGESITLTYTVTVDNRTAPPAATDANVTWTSMPGAPGSHVERSGSAHDDAPLGKIEGTLWDDTKPGNQEVLAGVEVTLTLKIDDKTTITLTTVTDANGKYNFGVLPKGSYTITVGNVEATVLNGNDTDTLTVRWDSDGGTLGTISGTLSEGQKLEGSDSKNFAYIQVNDKPIISTDGSSPTFIEGVNTAGDHNVLGSAVKLPDVTIKDVELENGLDNYKDTSLTVARSDGANGFAKNAEDIFSLTGNGLTISGNSITVGSEVVATFTNAGGELKITFTDKANMVIVNQIANAISYANSSQNPSSSVALRYRFDDANDGDKQGTGINLTGDATVTVNITKQNDLPEAVGTLPNKTAVDNSAMTDIPTAAGFKDVDNDTLKYSVTGLPPGLTIDATTGVISGTPDKNASQGGDPNNKGSYTAVVTAEDPDGLKTTQTFEIKISNPAPDAVADTHSVSAGGTVGSNVISGNGGAGVDTDPDGDTLTVTGVVKGTVNDINGVGTANIGSALTGTYGTLTLNANGSYSYVADQAAANAIPKGITQTDTFTYAISDGEGGVAYTTLTITVTGLNDAPEAAGTLPNKTAVDNSAMTDIPTAAGFKDVDGDKLKYSVTGLPPGLTIDATTGVISGTPDKNASQGGDPNNKGSYTAVVTAEDPDGLKTTQTFEIKISNPAPDAVADTHSVSAGGTVGSNVISGNGGAGVDTDPDGDTLTVTGVVKGTVNDINGVGTANIGSALTGTYGTLTLNANGSYSYVADQAAANAIPKGITQTDTFTYAISDGEGGVAYTTLTITVTGLNDAPEAVGTLPNKTAVDNSAITNIPTAAGFKDVDGDKLKYSVTGLPPGLTIDATTGVISGTPNKNASQGGDPNNKGSYTVVVTAEDPDGLKTTQTFEIKISNPAPDAVADTHSVSAGGTVGSNVISGNGGAGVDTDPDGDTLTVTGVVKGSVTDINGVGTANIGSALTGTYGTLTLNANGSYSYVADQAAANAIPKGITQTDTFTYAISDGEGGVAYTTLTITVTGLNDAPEAVGTLPNKSGVDNSAITDIPTAAGFKDVDGDKLKYSVTGLPPGLTIDATTGVISGTPDKNASQGGDPNNKGSYTVVVTAEDPDGLKTTQTFEIKISNPAPTAQPDHQTIRGESSAAGNVLTGQGSTLPGSSIDIDPDGDALTVIGVAVGDRTNQGNFSGSVGDVIQGIHGSLQLQANGGYIYTRTDGGLAGSFTDVFTYVISDGEGGFATTTLTITIADGKPSLNPPSGSGVTPGNPSVGESGLPDGSNPDSGSNKTTGKLEIDSPDGVGTITVTPPDGGKPVTLDPAKGITSGTVDTPNGKVTVTYDPGNGTDKPSITWEYELKTPADNSNGKKPTDGFTITVTDLDGDITPPSTITIDIVDDVPDAQDDSNTTLVNVPVKGQLGGNDKPGADDIERWELTESPKSGTVVIDPITGEYTFTPKPGFVGTDTFTYTVTDTDGSTDTATVTITVTNQPPVAVDDSKVSEPGKPATGNVLTGGSSGDHADSDPDGQPVTVTEITVDGITIAIPPNDSVMILIPNKGFLEIGSDGSYTFTPLPLWGGQVPDISYTISDGFGGTDTAVLRITATAAPQYVAPPSHFNPSVPTDVGSSTHAPLTTPSSSSLGLGDAMSTTPSVFWESYSYFQNLRLPTVMHPVTYVNLEVQRAQLEALQGMLNNWHILSNAELRSMAIGLGLDPNLFVQHAVHASQQERHFGEFIARNIQVNLPTETPDQLSLSALNKNSEDLSADTSKPGGESKEQGQEPPQALLDLQERWNAAEIEPEATGLMTAVMAGKSSSFTDQLKEQAHQLPSHVG